MGKTEDLLGDEMMSALPKVLRQCLVEPRWWDDELAGLHVVKGLTELVLPSSCDSYRRVDNVPSHAGTGRATLSYTRAPWCTRA